MTRVTLLLISFLLLTSGSVHAQSTLHVAILGDSNTWLGGDNCDQPKGWNKWFKDRMKPATCRSYARSGATWTNTTETKLNTLEDIGKLGDDNVIYNQVMRLKEAFDNGMQTDPNVILIAAGTNDAWFIKKRPHAFDKNGNDVFGSSSSEVRALHPNEVLTLADAVRYNCELLMHFFPEAQIVLLSPMQTTAAPTKLIHEAGDIIEECGQHMGIHTIRQDYYSCVNTMREKELFRFTYDGTHTSIEGAKRNGYYIANQLKGILQY